ncbi:hypothetical protein B566_EDAN001967 [Ephemera danica]|nr:hypothetical protein B566_EDAN001967 [Ephemera danica]
MRKVAFKNLDQDIERIRRAHLNDLENIPAFVLVSFLYILTAPEQVLAVNLFRVFTAARVVHTFVYAVRPVPQPARALCFATGLEDAKLCGTTVKFGNTDVERVRRAHLNDLENIPAFVLVSLLYILTAPEQALAVNLFRVAHLNDLENIPAFVLVSFLYILTAPEQVLAVNLFRVFTAARVAHTFVYAVRPVPQPARGLCFGTGLGVTGYMLFKVMQHFCTCSSV